jgi:tellurite resistance protein TerC
MLTAIHWYEWAGFAALMIGAIGFDLFRSKDDHSPSLKESAMWTGIYVGLALLFGLYVYAAHGAELMMQYYAGYALEEALSVDNLFVMETIFTFFGLAGGLRHRALAWGILGAIVMRTVLIFLGVGLVTKFTWLLPLFGVILLVTAYKLAFSHEDEDSDLSDNKIYQLVSRILPVHNGLVGHDLVTKINGAWKLTTLGMAILMVEVTDLVFAVDSIPAVMGVSRSFFVILTSNLFAVMGLRALFFVLSGVMGMFRFLKPALSIVLAFIGAKMMAPLLVEGLNFTGLTSIDPEMAHVPVSVSLIVVLGTIALAILASVLIPEKKRAPESAE